MKDSDQITAKLIVNGYDAFHKARKLEKKIKRQIVCSLAVGLSGIALMLGSLICSTACWTKLAKILEQNDYENANAKYKAELAMELSEQYETQEIDNKTYMAEIFKN